jgi:hypothetical protein
LWLWSIWPRRTLICPIGLAQPWMMRLADLAGLDAHRHRMSGGDLIAAADQDDDENQSLRMTLCWRHWGADQRRPRPPNPKPPTDEPIWPAVDRRTTLTRWIRCQHAPPTNRPCPVLTEKLGAPAPVIRIRRSMPPAPVAAPIAESPDLPCRRPFLSDERKPRYRRLAARAGNPCRSVSRAKAAGCGASLCRSSRMAANGLSRAGDDGQTV